MSSISDKNNWKVVMKALPVIGFTEEEVQVSSHHSIVYITLLLRALNIKYIIICF